MQQHLKKLFFKKANLALKCFSMQKISFSATYNAELIACRSFFQRFDKCDLKFSETEIPEGLEKLKNKVLNLNSEKLLCKEKIQLVQDIRSILDPVRKKLETEQKRIYYLDLKKCIKKETEQWKKNAISITVITSVFFFIWLYLNCLVLITFPPSWLLLGFEAVLLLNLFIIKGLASPTETKDSVGTILFYNYTEPHKQTALELERLTAKFYKTDSNLDAKSKQIVDLLIKLIANILSFKTPKEAYTAAQNIFNYKKYFAQILTYILTDPKIKPRLWLFNTFLVRFSLSRFFNRIELTEEEKAELMPILEYFAADMGIDPVKLKKLFEEKRWNTLFDMVFA